MNAFCAWAGTRNCQIVPRNSYYPIQKNDILEPRMSSPQPRAPVCNVLAANIKATKVATEHAIISYKRQLTIPYLPTSNPYHVCVFNCFRVPIGLYARGVCMRAG